MKVLQFEEAKKIELEILKEFSDFCDENKLTYFLAYGTLIGAIRHKGFIPWDDDIDIWMPREDYNKFKELFNSQKVGGYYKAILPSDKVSRHTFVKVVDDRTVKLEKGVSYKSGTLGIDIDIFPLDGQPDDDTVYDAWYNKLFNLYKCHYYLITKFPSAMSSKIKLLLRRIIVRIMYLTKSNILRKADKLHQKYQYENSNFVGAIESCYNFKSNRYKKEWFSEAVLVDFEEYKFKAPIGYHEILTKMYGDYMKLPPLEKRVTHHTNNTFWKD